MSSKFLLLQYLVWMNLGEKQADYITEHCYAMKSGSSLSFANRVCGTSQASEGEVDQIISYFGDTPFRWFVENNDHALIQKLEQKNLKYICSFPAMQIDLGNVKPTLYSEHIAIDQVHDEISLKTWITVVARSYNINALEFSKLIAYFIRKIDQSNLKFYLGLYNGKPVATSMFIRHGDIIDVHWVGTLPEYRNKGIGYAVSHKPLVDAQAQGCTQAILFASQLGKSVYERIGFKEYELYKVYGN